MNRSLHLLRKSLLDVEHGLLLLLTVVFLLVGIPSYIDVGGAVRISYYFLALVLAILFFLLVGIVVIDSRKQVLKEKWLKLPQLLPPLVAFGIPLILAYKLIQDHESSWKLLSKAWTEMSDLNQTEALSSWQEKGNCCGFMGPYDYLSKGLDLPKNCFYYIESEQMVKDGCYKVLRDDAFIIHFMIVLTFALYLVVKVARHFLEWKADKDNYNDKRRSIDVPLILRNMVENSSF